MKKNTIITLSIVLVLAIIGILIGTGSFSIIGEFSKSQCQLNENNTCEITLTLPEYRNLNSYTLDLSFKKVPGVYGEQVQLTPVSQIGPVYEDYDIELTTSLEELYTYYYYFYRIPSDWDESKIYGIKMDSMANGWVKITKDTSRAQIDHYIGYVAIPYPSNSVPLCGEDYDSTTCIVRNYLRDDGERRDYFYNSATIASNNDLDTSDSPYTLGTQKTGSLNPVGQFVYQDVVTSIGATKENLMLFVRFEAEQDEKGYATYGLSLPPTLKVSYSSSLRPTDVQLYVGDTLVDSYTGQLDNVTTKDINAAINTYCERETSTSKCDVPIRFTSDEGGLIIVENENAILRASDDPNYKPPSNNFLTGAVTFLGNSFDYKESPTQAYITSGLLFTIIVGLLIFGGKKK